VKIFIIMFAVLLAAAARGGDSPFRVGEKLSYRIYWGPFEAGQASLEVAGIEAVNGRDCYHLVAKAQTSGLIDMLFHVDNTLESWLDVEELRTLRYRQKRIEGKHPKQSETHFDYVKGSFTLTNYLARTGCTLPLAKSVQDILSAVYYVRSQSVQLKQPLTFLVNAGDSTRMVRIVPDQQKKIWTNPLGEVPALRIEPNPTLTIVASNKGRMWVWFSDDAQKVPLVLISKLAIGSARFQLTEVTATDPALAKRLKVASPN
jgi:hypothetical protein